MKEHSLDHHHREKHGQLGQTHGDTLVSALRGVYGQGFAAGYPGATRLSDVLGQLNATSLSQLQRDHATGHLDKKLAKASK